MTATDILNFLMKEVPSQMKISGVTIGKELRYLGFEQSQTYKEGARFQIKGYYVIKKQEETRVEITATFK